jgi:hypothetical protein
MYSRVDVLWGHFVLLPVSKSGREGRRVVDRSAVRNTSMFADGSALLPVS